MPRKSQCFLPELSFWWEPAGYVAHVNILRNEGHAVKQLPFELTVAPLFGQDEGKWSWAALLVQPGRFCRSGIAPTLGKAQAEAEVAVGIVYREYLRRTTKSNRRSRSATKNLVVA